MNFEEYLIADTPAEKQVKEYILANASDILKDKIQKTEKNIADCLNYVSNQVKDKAKRGCYCATDEEVFGMCIHYFEEESIQKDNNKTAKVETSSKQVIEKLETPKKKAPKKKEEPEQKGYSQMSIFDM